MNKFNNLLGLLIILLSFLVLAEQESSDLQLSVQAQKTKKIKIGLVSLGTVDSEFKQLLARLKKDLEWSNQSIVEQKHLDTLKHERELKDLFEPNVLIAIIISNDHKVYSWHLYDVSSIKMLAGKKIKQDTNTLDYVAHTIADQVWPELFATQSSFRSKIAYSKQIWRKKFGKDKPYKQIWITDFDGSNPQLFVDTPTVSFAPRWNNDVACPLLFYSENTVSNVQLVMSNMFGKRKVICSFDGLNMQPTFSQDGKKIVFCLSKDGTSQLYLSYINHVSGQRHFDRLTFNTGDNIAPCFVDDTHIAFVSDYKTGKPQIYLLDLKTKSIESITDGGYCACPAYSFVRKQLVYSKMMGAGMQLFLYDLKTEKHTQITDGPGSKEEGSWSSCGNYIIFGLNKGLESRVAQLHIPTKTIKFLTAEKDNCTYPSCSPIYDEILGILHK
ncbi:PD40 domain-containing protein [Candidatus Dependentiae bacterium]|nr:PD40 domain-containing protein [Candidatus Dependentiae bacterium]